MEEVLKPKNDESCRLKHHKRFDLCTTRAQYRQGRKLTAVKVYTVCQESEYLLLQGIPSVATNADVLRICSRYGHVDKWRHLGDFSREEFTEVYLIKYKEIRSARAAKRKLDDSSFYGGILHVSYAPEYETVNETRTKLAQRRQDVARHKARLRKEARAMEEDSEPESKNKKLFELEPSKMVEETEANTNNRMGDGANIRDMSNAIESPVIQPAIQSPVTHRVSIGGAKPSRPTHTAAAAAQWHRQSYCGTIYASQVPESEMDMRLSTNSDSGGSAGGNAYGTGSTDSTQPNSSNLPAGLRTGQHVSRDASKPHSHETLNNTSKTLNTETFVRPPPQNMNVSSGSRQSDMSRVTIISENKTASLPPYNLPLPPRELVIRPQGTVTGRRPAFVPRQTRSQRTVIPYKLLEAVTRCVGEKQASPHTNIVTGVIAKDVQGVVVSDANGKTGDEQRKADKVESAQQKDGKVLNGRDIEGKVGSIQRREENKRKVDPVNERLRREAFILGKRKAGPEVLDGTARDEFESRENPTNERWLTDSVQDIRQKVLQFSVHALPPQLKRVRRQQKAPVARKLPGGSEGK